MAEQLSLNFTCRGPGLIFLAPPLVTFQQIDRNRPHVPPAVVPNHSLLRKKTHTRKPSNKPKHFYVKIYANIYLQLFRCLEKTDRCLKMRPTHKFLWF